MREEGRELASDPDLVLKCHLLVANYYQHHRVFAQAFASNKGASALPSTGHTFPSNRIASVLRRVWERFERRLYERSETPLEAAELDRLPSADDLDSIAAEQKAREATEPEPKPELPGDCGYANLTTVVVRVRCSKGKMIDLDGKVYGVCPNCLGAFAMKGSAA